MKARRQKVRKKKKTFKFLVRMKKKLFVLFFAIVGVLLVFIGRLAYIELKSGERYEKIVLNQQEYSSKTIPFRRGDIVDRKGTVLATSTDVYNVILDCSVLTSKKDYLEPTMAALAACFEEIDVTAVREYVSNNPDSKYYVLAKKLPYEEIAAFEELQNAEPNEETGDTGGKYIKGIWFEKEYIRNYPYDSLASSLLGFTTAGNEGIGGIEDQYNSTLNGTDGREYGYLNSDSNYEVNVKEAINGQTVVSTIDANLQSIVEKKIAEFNDAMKDGTNEGARHIGVIMMDPNNGEVLAMANYPNFNLSDPWNIDVDRYIKDEEKAKIEKQAERRALRKYYDADEISAMTEEQWDAALREHYTEEELEEIRHLALLDEIWQNFCVSYTYEPGSTAKPFTVAAGLDSGTLSGNEVYVCDGKEVISNHSIHCIKTAGHGSLTVQGALENSCNDALMQMSYAIGPQVFSKYQHIFNFGLKTNIDLPGEARTDSLIYKEEDLSKINLATNSFGQSFNVTMIQMISGYCSLINGGSYYQPHVVKQLLDENGNTVENIEGTLLKQTVSEETSDTILGYLQGVIENGSGKKAKVDGYSMGGKTGTAQKIPRSARKYLVSFIGHVPADNPQVAIYVVVDEANSEDQAHSYYAQSIAREIFKEALPYLNIYPDEEKTGVNEGLGITGEGTAQPTEQSEAMEGEVPTEPAGTEDGEVVETEGEGETGQ